MMGIMKLQWRHDDACECGEPGCYATAEVRLPDATFAGWVESARVRLAMLRRRIGSPQDPRTNGSVAR